MSGISLAPLALEALLRHAADGYPLEVCGLLLGHATGGLLHVTRAVPCPNAARPEERHRRFVIDPGAVLNVRRAVQGTSRSIVGFYHSHPDAGAGPSTADMRYARLWPRTAWVIVPVRDSAPRAPRAWWLDDAEGARPRELLIKAGAHAAAACPD